MQYRAEIDGLRAIAVLSVILYHAKVLIFGHDWFAGGYIGVDIFFVISGYLITRIILKELFEKGSFNFRRFYDRRSRRIFPMLFTVILVSLPFAWLLLLPKDFVEYGKSITAAILFCSNFFFYFSTTQYGAESALLKPLLHSWSLGIEEQFYIVFPLLLLLFHKYLKKHVLTLFLILFAISLCFANIMDRINPSLNFFLPFSRFWELLAGSILAYLHLKYGRINNKSLTTFLPAIGLVLLLGSIFYFDGNTPHPSFITLIPIIGVSLIIGFSSGKDFVGKILSLRVFTAIGLISYSLYLWHFPIFAFGRLTSEATYLDIAGWISLTFILSIISYYVIEKPFRKPLISSKIFYSGTSSIVILALAAFGFLHNNDGHLGRFSKEVTPLISATNFKKWDDYVWAKKHDIDISRKTFGDADKINLLIIGDSNSGDLINALDKTPYADRLNIVSIVVYVGCGNLYENYNNIVQHIEVNRRHKCPSVPVLYNEYVQKIIPKADKVIFASNWKDWEISRLAESDKKLQVQFGDKFIYFGVKATEYPYYKNAQDTKSFKPAEEFSKKLTQETIQTNHKLREIFGARFFSYTDMMCPKNTCPIMTEEGDVLQYDGFHLTPKGAELFSRRLPMSTFSH